MLLALAPRCTTRFVNFFDGPAWPGLAAALPLIALFCLPAACVAQTEPSPAPADQPAPLEWRATSTNGLFQVAVGPRSGKVLIGKFQVWDLRLADADGNPVFPARFAIGGGMQGHGHGLPTQPRVTDYLTDGRYVVEGMKFNMAGDWTLFLAIEAELGSDHEIRSDQVQIDITVDY